MTGGMGTMEAGSVSHRSEKAPTLTFAPSPCGRFNTVTLGRHHLSLPYPSAWESGPLYAHAKRATDVCVASTLLVVLFPLFLAIAVLIFLEDGGPILYWQTRVGQDGKHFRFYKFRSMVRNADQMKVTLEGRNEAGDVIFKMKNDPRITRIGRHLRRSSLDELPQFFNVLCGQMTLIGPRPHLPREVASYVGAQQDRLKVQPGLLCFREVFGRSGINFDQWVTLDLLYIEHRSLRTDWIILRRTIPAILSADGAY